MRQCAAQSGFVAGKEILTADDLDLKLGRNHAVFCSGYLIRPW
jgi:hypothetical protein